MDEEVRAQRYLALARASAPFIPAITKMGSVGIESVRKVIDHDDVKVLRFDTDVKRVMVGVSYGRERIDGASHLITEVFLGVMDGEPEYDPEQIPTVIRIPQGEIADDSWWISDYHWDKYGFYLNMFRSWDQTVGYEYIEPLPFVPELGR